MKSGSFFFAEMKRMMSSLRPFGARSSLMSVTKPHLYSWLVSGAIEAAGLPMKRRALQKNRLSHRVFRLDLRVKTPYYRNQRHDAHYGPTVNQQAEVHMSKSIADRGYS